MNYSEEELNELALSDNVNDRIIAALNGHVELINDPEIEVRQAVVDYCTNTYSNENNEQDNRTNELFKTVMNSLGLKIVKKENI